MAEKTHKPTIKGIARSLNKFTANWAISGSEEYVSHQFQHAVRVKGQKKLNKKDWSKTESLSKAATSKQFSINLDKYYPSKENGPRINQIYARVRSRAKDKKKSTNKKTVLKNWSAWHQRSRRIAKPKKPVVSLANDDGQNSATFAIDYKRMGDNASKYWSTDIEIQTALRINVDDKSGEKIGDSAWKKPSASSTDFPNSLIYNQTSGTHSRTIYDPVTEQSNKDWTVGPFVDSGADIVRHIENGEPVTRWLRVRGRGPAGHSGWAYAKKRYGKPRPAYDLSGNITEASAGVFEVLLAWKYISNKNLPISKFVIEYCFSKPGADGPANPSFQQGPTIYPNLTQDRIAGVGDMVPLKDLEFNGTGWGVKETIETYRTSGRLLVDRQSSDDEFLYLRVATYQANSEIPVYSDWHIPTNSDGTVPTDTILSPPSNLTVTVGEGNIIYVTASNNSDVEGSYLVVTWVGARQGAPEEIVKLDIGIMDDDYESVAIEIPFDRVGAYDIEVYCATGDYGDPERYEDESDPEGERGYDVYSFTPELRSVSIKQGGQIPQAPSYIHLDNLTKRGDEEGKVRVTWNWKAWKLANKAIVSWSDDKDTWDSNEEADSKEVWIWEGSGIIIKNLTLGKTYFFRIKLVHINESGGETESLWSDITPETTISLRSAPSIPTASVSPPVILEGRSTTLTWSYVTTDSTAQKQALIALGSETGVTEPAEYIGSVDGTSQSYVLDSEELGWTEGNTYYVAIKVLSESDCWSEDWSEVVPITIAEELTCEIDREAADYPLIKREDSDNPYLVGLPMTITVKGAGDNNTTELRIERVDDFDGDRPDGTTANGYEGETIYSEIHIGEEPFVIDMESLNGNYLDDKVEYRLRAIVSDIYGQKPEDEQVFQVDWAHQSLMPKVSVDTDQTNSIVKITILEPDEGEVEEGDYCEIYRISADKIELIATDCEFGETYVDPYPTIGVYGGHRIVYRTINGDYTTADNSLAWLDVVLEMFDPENVYSIGDIVVTPNRHVFQCLIDMEDPEDWNRAHWQLIEHGFDYVDSVENIIDYGSDQARLVYNVDFSTQWKKDFQETKYLGGSIQGDWNAAVSRTGTLNAVVVANDMETIKTLRQLATYAGACHVRTTDGSNYTANVDVTENKNYEPGLTTSYSLSFTRVDADGLDAMTLDEWEDNL